MHLRYNKCNKLNCTFIGLLNLVYMDFMRKGCIGECPDIILNGKYKSQEINIIKKFNFMLFFHLFTFRLEVKKI